MKVCLKIPVYFRGKTSPFYMRSMYEYHWRILSLEVMHNKIWHCHFLFYPALCKYFEVFLYILANLISGCVLFFISCNKYCKMYACICIIILQIQIVYISIRSGSESPNSWWLNILSNFVLRTTVWKLEQWS